MPKQNKPPVTQRAYTLRLRGTDLNDQSWRDALWKTHEAINKGAKAFGDWLLTLRGGLDHSLVDTKVKGGKGNPDRDPTDEERKTRRILLALSWLSVESKLGAPENFIVASGEESAQDRNNKVIAALEEILKSRGVAENEIDQWKKDCSASLSAAIREDAVWVNRSKAFDEAVKSVAFSLTRDEVWDMLERFFKSPTAYLDPAKGSEHEYSETEKEEKAKDIVQNAGQWLSSRFGTGKGADFSRMAEVYEKIAVWAGNAQAGTTWNEAIRNLAAALSKFSPKTNDLQGVDGLISGTGHKSRTKNLLKVLAAKSEVTIQDLEILKNNAAEDARKCFQKKGSKGHLPYSDAILRDVESVCGFTYLQNGGPARHFEFAVMLGHAARRVSLAHTWIKRAEAERRRFEEDAKKMDNVPVKTKEWLDEFIRERSGFSGALEPYQIRRRAVDGWKEVVAAWSKAVCKTAEDRIAAARALQDDPEIDKFGDIQLFEALAADDALCVWHNEGNATNAPDPQPLIDYVLAAEAEFKKRHFKVPAYRHPDPLLHPVFCDFGKSSWDIKFAVHSFSKKRGRSNNRMTESNDLHAFSMTLWTGVRMQPVSLYWQSKRLARDLAFGKYVRNEGAIAVTRADRLGRAASNTSNNDLVTIAGLFEQEYWNGRLEAPRRQLEAIARYVEKHGWDDQAEKMRDQIKWFVTFSAKLQPQGPWCAFAQKLRLSINPQYWPFADANKKRKAHAKLILSRLPGLRVLSVDLGHRYAAACAVWEALSSEEVLQACRAVGHEDPKESDLYLHLKKKVTKQKKGNPVEVEETTIYRRIGADKLPDGTPHPAPWARLDRQFLIKLQGEEEGVRQASNEEIWQVHQLEAALGRSKPLINRLISSGWGITKNQQSRIEALKKLGWCPPEQPESGDVSDADEEEITYKPPLSVDELMSSAVRTMRLALKRHGDRARIAHYLITDEKTKPGGVKEKLDANGRTEMLQDALVLWHDLFSSRSWRDDAAKQLWDEHIIKLTGDKLPEEIGEDASESERGKKKKENREKLHDAAKALAEDESLRKTLHDLWKTRWEEDDRQWKKHLRWFSDWVLPRGKAADDPAIRKVGGLSLTRLATLTEFRRKVQVGFFTRLHPDGTRAETKEQFGLSTLDALERMREQRVKQLASRIAEAALGIGSQDKRHWEGGNRPRRRINDPRFAPCHAVVIEDLTHYRPEETRTRRENRQLMTWSSSKVKKYLAEACQLYGLHFREIFAGYTSVQDSRTGAPGIRCQDVPVKEFMRSPFWRKQVKQAETKLSENKGDARERFLCSLNAMWKDKAVTDWERAGVVRLPLKGGEVFVSADPLSPAARGLQADLNAAANIGLRALTDSDWPGKWWYVPCESSSLRPVKEKVEGSPAVNPTQALPQSAQKQNDGAGAKKKRKGSGTGKPKEVVNLWRDVSSSPLDDPNAGEWKEYTAYQNEVQWRVVRILEEELKGRFQRLYEGAKEDGIPF